MATDVWIAGAAEKLLLTNNTGISSCEDPWQPTCGSQHLDSKDCSIGQAEASWMNCQVQRVVICVCVGGGGRRVGHNA